MLSKVAYLNAGAFGPLPARTAQAMEEVIERTTAHGRSGDDYFKHVVSLRETLRTRLAELIGARPTELALTRSTTDGCNIAVSALRLTDRDEVVTTDVEHPALEGALHVCSARVRVARIRDLPVDAALEAIEAEITPRTRLLALSHVAWTTGAVLPVHELTARDIPVLVDGAQGTGAVPVDVRALGCDFYTVSGQKWLLGPDATGALYVHPDRVSELSIPFPSYMSWERGTLTPREGAQRFDPGWVPSESVAGLLESLSFADDAGADRFQRAREMADRCRELLKETVDVITARGQATLVTFRTGERGPEVVRRLAASGVIVRDLPGADWVRASVGFWTSDDDLERLAEALAAH